MANAKGTYNPTQPCWVVPCSLSYLSFTGFAVEPICIYLYFILSLSILTPSGNQYGWNSSRLIQFTGIHNLGNLGNYSGQSATNNKTTTTTTKSLYYNLEPHNMCHSVTVSQCHSVTVALDLTLKHWLINSVEPGLNVALGKPRLHQAECIREWSFPGTLDRSQHSLSQFQDLKGQWCFGAYLIELIRRNQ